jgi:hypothetical protein
MSAYTKIDDIDRHGLNWERLGALNREWEIVRRGRILGKLLLMVLGRSRRRQKGLETR